MWHEAQKETQVDHMDDVKKLAWWVLPFVYIYSNGRT